MSMRSDARQGIEQINGHETHMLNNELHERIISTADEYHMTAEDYWNELTALKPDAEELDFDFRRLTRAAIRYYARAYLALDMIETDDGQDVDDLLEVIAEQIPELDEFFTKNNVIGVIDEEGSDTLSRVFAVAESVRTMLLERSNQLAASLASRFEPK